MKINCDRSCTLSETLLGAHWVGPRDLVKQRIYPTKTSLPALAALEITHLAVFTFQLYRLTCYLSNRVHCIGIHEIIATSWIIRNSITSSTSLGTNNQRSLMPPQHSWHVTILTLTGDWSATGSRKHKGSIQKLAQKYRDDTSSGLSKAFWVKLKNHSRVHWLLMTSLHFQTSCTTKWMKLG